jgi:hypothetical protein
MSGERRGVRLVIRGANEARAWDGTELVSCNYESSAGQRGVELWRMLQILGHSSR